MSVFPSYCEGLLVQKNKWGEKKAPKAKARSDAPCKIKICNKCEDKRFSSQIVLIPF